MKKLLVLVSLFLSGCVVAPVGYRSAYIEPACCIYVGGIEGFYFGGHFYHRNEWHPGFGRHR